MRKTRSRIRVQDRQSKLESYYSLAVVASNKLAILFAVSVAHQTPGET